jgi:hypothetical protein
MDELKYIIFECNEINKIDFNEVRETSSETLRISIDGTKTFIKYEGETPNSIMDLLTKSIEHTQQEMLNILSTDEWTISQELN